MLETLIELSDVNPEVKVDPALLRPSDVTLQVPDISKFKKATGWSAKISFKETMEDILNYWRKRVRKELNQRELAEC